MLCGPENGKWERIIVNLKPDVRQYILTHIEKEGRDRTALPDPGVNAKAFIDFAPKGNITCVILV